MAKRKLSPHEITRLYEEQWTFLRKSCDAYDVGDVSEAKRIAVCLRVLLHDTRRSHSLLRHLKMQDLLFFDTSRDVDPRNLAPTLGLVFVAMSPTNAAYVAPLGLALGYPVWMVPFAHWWTKIVMHVPNEIDVTRADLVLSMANQDGGAHVDGSLNETYYRLTREHVGGWSLNAPNGPAPLEDIEGASIRQIAQEVLITLLSGHRMIPSDLPAELSDENWKAQFGSYPSEKNAEARARFRNMCPCASGLEYKECHMAGGRNVGRIVAPRWASQ